MVWKKFLWNLRNLWFISGILLFSISGSSVCFAEDAAIYTARMNVCNLIEAGNFIEAKAAADKLLSDYSGNKDLAEAFYRIADRFQQFDRFDDAKEIHRQIIRNFSDSPWAGKAKIQLSSADISILVLSQNYDNATIALDKFTADYANNPDFPEAIFWIAERYQRNDRFADAKQIYENIILTYPDISWAEKSKFWLSRINCLSLIVAQNYDGAKIALDKFIADFANSPDLPEALYWIAERYERQGRFAEANCLYRQIESNYPEDKYAKKARFDIRETDIRILLEANDVNEAEILTDKFIADFRQDPRVHDAVYQIGENYCIMVSRFGKEDLDGEVKAYYRKALTVWEKIATQLPYSPVYTPQAYYAAADCYSDLGDYNSAVNYHKKVIADYPDFKNRYMAMFMLTDCYRKQADAGQISQEESKEQIISIYKELLEKYPQCSVAVIVREQLLQMGEEIPQKQ